MTLLVSLGCTFVGVLEEGLAVFCELGRSEWFGEDICRVVRRVDFVEFEVPFVYLFPYVMVLHFDVS